MPIRSQQSSSNNKHNVIGGNGQISPVSQHSFQFTENDNKISFGSYDPSRISSQVQFNAGQLQQGQLPMEIGKIRMSLLNFAGNQMNI